MADYPVPEAPVEAAAPVSPEAPVEKKNKPVYDDIAKALHQQIKESKAHRRTFHAEWKENIQARLGKSPAGDDAYGYDDEPRSEVNPDWALTKTKTANLYSQVPSVQLTHENKAYMPAVGPFAKALNYEIGTKRAHIGVAMEENLNDVVNASGIAFAVAGYAARFEDIEVPEAGLVGKLPQWAIDKAISMGLVKTRKVPRVTDYKFFVKRISPSMGLWPKNFAGSDFNDADYAGYSDELSWGEAKVELKLTDKQKEEILTNAGKRHSQDNLKIDEHTGNEEPAVVRFDTLFYWRYRVDPECKSFKEIWKIVFVEGLEEPVIHEHWNGQKLIPGTNKYVGACKFPVQIATLTYVSDNPVPPSDSSAARPQTNDMRRSRNQMFHNREMSAPMRWVDVLRVDGVVLDNIMRGGWQKIIPTMGAGDKVIGEVARGNYPPEDMAFDRQTKSDMLETWQISPNQLGTLQTGEHTKAEVENTQANFATRIGQERARIAAHFLNLVEVVAGLMALYSDFPSLSEEERQQMYAAWDSKQILHDLAFTIRPDSTILLDTQSQIDRAIKYLNITAKSGYVNVKPVIEHLTELHGYDMSWVVDPEPPKPEAANISFRFSGKDDLMNPAVMAVLFEEGKAPSPQALQAAIKFLEAAQTHVVPMPPPQGAPAGPEGGGPPQEANEQMTLANKVSQRADDLGGQ